MKIMTVIGTRPEGIKMAPVIKLLAQDPSLKSVVVTTGQHREMLQTVFEVFDFKPDYDLNDHGVKSDADPDYQPGSTGDGNASCSRKSLI